MSRYLFGIWKDYASGWRAWIWSDHDGRTVRPDDCEGAARLPDAGGSDNRRTLQRLRQSLIREATALIAGPIDGINISRHIRDGHAFDAE